MKPPYAIGSVPSLSGHAIAYRWRSLPRVRRHRASKPQGSSERVLPWQITMDQLIFASLSHTHYWYEVGMLKVPYGHVKATLQAMKNRDRAEIIRMVGTWYSTLPQKKRSQRSRPGRPSKRSSRVRAAAGVVRDEVVAAVAAGAAARVEVAVAEEAVAAPVVPEVVATAAVADLMAAVGDTTGGATSGRSAPRRRATSSPSVLGARVLATRRAHAHRTRRCWRWSCRCQKRISPWKLRRSWRRKQASAE